MDLIIVESPKKAKTIEKFLKGKYKVLGSGGHIRELPEKSFGIDFNDNFKPTYVIEPKHVKTVNELKAAANKSDIIYLATDPDREGEAIAWHLDEVLDIHNKSYRIKYNEISEKAVTAALAAPGKIDYNLVNSQQARRVLDRIVGYKLSPYVRQRVESCESAGRVQSVAVRLIVELERKIQNFVPEEYWVVGAFLNKIGDKNVFKSLLVTKNGKKYKPSNSTEADEVYNTCSSGKYIVNNVKKAESKSHPLPPFTTSTMQQDASIKFGLSSPEIMKVAQELYEGIETKSGHLAFVTYIRTDSTRISADAQKDCLQFIKDNFGDGYCPAKPNIYAAKKNAQDAHEAIRPIDINMTPDKAKEILNRNQYHLYKLIYERYLASQMSDAIYNTVQINIGCDIYGFKATGKTIKFKGFTAVYNFESKKADEEEEDNNKLLPEISEGEELHLDRLEKTQKFTKPPVRYSDSSLVKAMEEKGIGRPSTYATIIKTLVDRKYVERKEKYLVPTEMAFKATDLLVANFGDIVNVDFTARMEDQLDDIAEKSMVWQDVVRAFYDPFMAELKKAQDSGVETDEKCPNCGANMLKKVGRYGEYLVCPKCKETKNMAQEEETQFECNVCHGKIVRKISKGGEYYYCNTCRKVAYPFDSNSGVKCPVCNGELILRNGKFGEYLLCEHCNFSMQKDDEITDKVCSKCGKIMIKKKGKYGMYYKCIGCNAMESIAEAVGVCPDCGKPVSKRTSKTGKLFYGCTGYPDCKFMSWDIPTGEKCPLCGGYIVKDKKGQIKCSNRECNYTKI